MCLSLPRLDRCSSLNPRFFHNCKYKDMLSVHRHTFRKFPYLDFHHLPKISFDTLKCNLLKIRYHFYNFLTLGSYVAFSVLLHCISCPAISSPLVISRCSTLTSSGSTIVSSWKATICFSISSLSAQSIVQRMEHKHRIVILRYGGKVFESVFLPLLFRP